MGRLPPGSLAASTFSRFSCKRPDLHQLKFSAGCGAAIEGFLYALNRTGPCMPDL